MLYQLKLRGYDDIWVISTEWENRDNFQPLYPHRPEAYPFFPQQIAKNLGYKYDHISSSIRLEGDLILIGGAGILPQRDLKIINAHPGYLPYTRGLDALKWAIYEGMPIGVTTYFIGDLCDTGVLIRQEYTTRECLDTFTAFAMRHYETEIRLLADSIEDSKTPENQIVGGDRSDIHRRMPHYLEVVMLKKFEGMAS